VRAADRGKLRFFDNLRISFAERDFGDFFENLHCSELLFKHLERNVPRAKTVEVGAFIERLERFSSAFIEELKRQLSGDFGFGVGILRDFEIVKMFGHKKAVYSKTAFKSTLTTIFTNRSSLR